MDKFWENYITTRPVDSKGAFEEFKQMNQDPRPTIPGPRNMQLAKANIPRHLWTNVNTPDLEQSPDSFLRPGETLEDWDVSFRRPNADGGRAGYTGGGPIDVLDPQFKLADAIKAYQDYYSGSGKKKRKIPFKTFFRIYAKENFAQGGSAGQLVTPNVDGSRPGYADNPGSGAKKGLIPRQTSAKKRATRYKKILENLPEGYYDEYVKNFYNVEETGKLTHVGGGLNPKKGIPYMEKKYGNILKKTLPSMPKLKIKDVNAAIIQSIEDQIESGLNAGKKIRKQKEGIGKKYASKDDLIDLRNIKNKKSQLNKYFMENPDAINNTEFGKEIKKQMDIRIAGKDMEWDGKKIKKGDIWFKTRPDKYYYDVAKSDRGLFHIFDVTPIESGERFTRVPDNLNLATRDFNSGFVRQLNAFFKKDGKLHGNTESLKKVTDILDDYNIRVKIDDVGRIGTHEQVAVKRAEGTYPRITKTLERFKLPDELKKISREITSPPKNIKGAISVELLDDMFKAGKITVGTSKGIMQAARKMGAEFEIAFILGEYFNNVGKGQETDLAWANAKQSATMGFWKGGDRKYLEKLKELAKEEGIDSKTFEKVYEINKREHLATTMGMTGKLSPIAQIKTLEDQLKELKAYPKIYQNKKIIAAKENLLNIKKGQLEKYKKETLDKEYELIFDIRKNKAGYGHSVHPNLQKIAETPVYEEEYSDAFKNLGNIAVKYLDREKKKAYNPKKPWVPKKIKRLLNIPADQSEQLHSDMGPWGNLLSTNIFNMDVLTKQLPEMGKYAWDVINPTTPLPKLRTDFRTEAQKEQHRILDMVKKGGPGELYRYNLARDVGPGITWESYKNLIEKYPGLGIRTGEASGGRAGYMGGGIAGIRKPDAIPPERQGLRSIMINDKDY